MFYNAHCINSGIALGGSMGENGGPGVLTTHEIFLWKHLIPRHSCQSGSHIRLVGVTFLVAQHPKMGFIPFYKALYILRGAIWEEFGLGIRHWAATTCVLSKALHSKLDGMLNRKSL